MFYLSFPAHIQNTKLKKGIAPPSHLSTDEIAFF